VGVEVQVRSCWGHWSTCYLIQDLSTRLWDRAHMLSGRVYGRHIMKSNVGFLPSCTVASASWTPVQGSTGLLRGPWIWLSDAVLTLGVDRPLEMHNGAVRSNDHLHVQDVQEGESKAEKQLILKWKSVSHAVGSIFHSHLSMLFNMTSKGHTHTMWCVCVCVDGERHISK